MVCTWQCVLIKSKLSRWLIFHHQKKLWHQFCLINSSWQDINIDIRIMYRLDHCHEEACMTYLYIVTNRFCTAKPIAQLFSAWKTLLDHPKINWNIVQFKFNWWNCGYTHRWGWCVANHNQWMTVWFRGAMCSSSFIRPIFVRVSLSTACGSCWCVWYCVLEMSM